MGLLKNIEWTDNSSNVIVYKYQMKNDYISKGSALTVRESQAVVFCDKGRMGDVFLPGFYKLDTNSIPIITKLLSWKYGFENPFRSDVFFVNTKQFTNQKWGTTNPIIVRDADYGAVRVRGFGTYSFKVEDPYVFMQQLFGTNSSFKTEDITEYLKSIVITGITDTIGESKIPILDMAGNLKEFGALVEQGLQDDFKLLGLKLVKFYFQNFSMPPELEEALDKSTSLGIMGKNMHVYTQKAQADALVEAAKNTSGGTMNAGMGIGMGVGMGNMFGNMMNQQNTTPAANQMTCPKCSKPMSSTAKFCPSCGATNGIACPKCKAIVGDNAKFCPDCGHTLVSKCPKCNEEVKGTKFCSNCGTKI